ncbi:hypothetical protein [Streptomyces olivaceoviridis]|uniref:hypothetical protein n=1 Tax=Streptomyces olivaceoviridis TaxID=1921 RepID=UPI00331CC83E
MVTAERGKPEVRRRLSRPVVLAAAVALADREGPAALPCAAWRRTWAWSRWRSTGIARAFAGVVHAHSEVLPVLAARPLAVPVARRPEP